MRLHSETNTEWKNLFQLWRDNNERLPFYVVRNSWSATAPHYLRVERVEIGKWPYGKAWGTFHYGGKPGTQGEKISVAGTYAWRMMGAGDLGLPPEANG